MAYGSVNVGSEKVDKNAYVTSEKVGVAGGIATLDANGKLTASQRPDVDCYTQAQTDEKISDAVLAHNEDETAHGDIRSAIDAVSAAVQAIELKYGTSITENAFTVSFGSLDGLVVTGVWNESQARIEF